ncbi:MAG: hypothetical protein FJ222_10015 [Lentisphaerae bacterium]|nr:hypothetical protein [Lentisphaerota bacterium]
MRGCWQARRWTRLKPARRTSEMNMVDVERQRAVLNLLRDLRSLEGLKSLFWEELNYERENKPLSPRQWPDSARQALAEDPILFASGGEDGAFHVFYCRLASPDLSRGLERPVVNQLLRDHPYALFVFSNKSQSAWHFLNVKYDEKAENRRLFRRITVRPGAGLRTAAERVQLLDLAVINPQLLGITPLAIQQRCDVAFDVEAVTKDFFREVANWYFWALKNVQFPKDAPKEADGHDHISVIRLITRLIFCWFVKEKGLIPDTLFDERTLARTLTGFEPAKTGDKQSVFYRAILQNLFFATLNTEMDKRGWTKEEQNFMAHSLYRHRDCFSEPKSTLDLFKEIPFLNGGLFECLDKDLGFPAAPHACAATADRNAAQACENAKSRYVRIDGFSRREDSQPIVPDFLFFGPEREVDLSADYNDKKFGRVPVRGLIHIFNRYHFTIEENTPIEQEVALDPELSGKVFENLLAAYNPETGATARKQTGSFYTPREIVNYMVDEALIACLKTKVEQTFLSVGQGGTGIPACTSQSNSTDRNVCATLEHKLRHLFAYNDEPHQFTPSEVDALIAAIDGLKSIDPAVGSGAFPMGILHKLVFILGILDPRNEKWKERQIARVRDTMATAEKIEDATARERAVRELEQHIAGINEAFENNELDYGRKLYLIENCIYGVDIQPIAVQIAKMRFFISLIVDQKIDDAQPNRGVRPLPNLETKFVAANTLIGVNRPGQQLLRNLDIDKKEAELRRVRERHFLARTPRQKAKCRDDDTRLRAEIAELLKGDGWDTTTARRLASWNPYDQNTSADFFDQEWMFGVTDGYDVVSSNPPYGFHKIHGDEAKAYFKQHYASSQGSYEHYFLFYEAALRLLGKAGVLAFIAPVTWLTIPSAKSLRRYILERYSLSAICWLSEQAFDSARVNTLISLITNSTASITSVKIYDLLAEFPNMPKKHRDIPQNQFVDAGHYISIFSGVEDNSILEKVRRVSKPLKDFARPCSGYNPYEVGAGEAPDGGPHTEDTVRERPYHSRSKCGSQWKPEITGRDLRRYCVRVTGDRWVKYGPWLSAALVSDLKKLPIFPASDSQQVAIAKLARRISDAKQQDPNADTTTLEREIDQKVYALYGLTPEEIEIVEGASTKP